MTAGWFDAWRDDGGPALHADPNRTHVTVDTPELFICVAFASLFLAFLIITPGIRKERVTTAVCVSVSLAVGVSILTAIYGGGWHVARASTNTYFKAFTDDRLPAQLGVSIGLAAVNVTYTATPDHHHQHHAALANRSTSTSSAAAAAAATTTTAAIDVHFNERFHFTRPTTIQQEYRESLVKGLPYPILTVLDYLRQDSDGFTWGRAYRKAGFWASYLLWWSFALWLLSNLLLCAVPRYGAYLFSVTGLVMLVAVWIYAVMLPSNPLIIPMENGSFLKFDLGWCFYTVLILGIIAFITGTTMAVMDTLWPSKFSTILEVDYDTPYRYFVGQGYSNSRCSSLVPTPHSTITARTPKGQEQLFKVLEKLEDELSRSEFGDDNSEFGGRDNAAYDGSSEENLADLQKPPRAFDDVKLPKEISAAAASSGGGAHSRDAGSRDGAGKRTEVVTRVEAEINSADEPAGEFEMVDGKRAITLQDFGKFANRMADAAARTRSHPFGAGVTGRRTTSGAFGAVTPPPPPATPALPIMAEQPPPPPPLTAPPTAQQPCVAAEVASKASPMKEQPPAVSLVSQMDNGTTTIQIGHTGRSAGEPETNLGDDECREYGVRICSGDLCKTPELKVEALFGSASSNNREANDSVLASVISLRTDASSEKDDEVLLATSSAAAVSEKL